MKRIQPRMRQGSLMPNAGKCAECIQIIDIETRRAMQRTHDPAPRQNIVICRPINLIESDAQAKLRKKTRRQPIAVAECRMNFIVELAMLRIEQIDKQRFFETPGEIVFERSDIAGVQMRKTMRYA